MHTIFLILLLVEKAKIAQETTKSSSARHEKVKALDDNHKEALLEFDRTFLNKLDHKVLIVKFFLSKNVDMILFQVADQQCTLELAGVPGFYVTTNPVDIQAQMHLLDFILQLSVLKPDWLNLFFQQKEKGLNFNY